MFFYGIRSLEGSRRQNFVDIRVDLEVSVASITLLGGFVGGFPISAVGTSYRSGFGRGFCQKWI